MKIISTFVVVFFTTLFLVVCGSEKVEDGPAKEYATYKVGDKITLKSVHGTSKTLTRVEGGFTLDGEEKKILMFDVFGTFCPPCQDEANDLMELQLKNSDDFVLMGLTHMEDVTNKHVIEQFAQKYNAFYFISNNKEENNRLISQMLRDIDYKRVIQLPFKFVLKGGKYQTLTDAWDGSAGVKYYIGQVDTAIMQKDIDGIKVTK